MQFPSLLGHTQELLSIIRKSPKPADHLIDSFFRSHKYLGSHDRRFVAETTYGTLRHLRRCEAFVKGALGELSNSFSVEDSSLLLLAAYLVKFDHRKDVSPKVLEPKLRSAILKESLLRFLSRLSEAGEKLSEIPVERIALAHSFPDWIIERWVGSYGEGETEELCASLNIPAPVTIRVNTLKTNVKQCQEALEKQGIESGPTKLSSVGLLIRRRINVFQLESFRDGWFEVQDEGSQIVPLLIDPKPTWKVLDACAGAGGKTLQLAAMMQNRGEIFAVDVNSIRLQALRKRAKRAGAFNVRVMEADILGSKIGDFSGFFDAILVDAPCTGLGTIRRNPGLKWSVTEQTVAELSEKQLQILQSNKALVKKGGRIFYATCTILSEENESVIEGFLKSNPEFILVHPGDLAKKWNLSDCVDEGFFRLYPHRQGTDGFFCAVLERTA